MSAPDDPLSPALHSVVERFGTMMRRVGARYRLSNPDIDELIQEVRIRLWRSRPTSELLAAVSASYMYRAALTAALTVIRRRRVKTHGKDEPLDERHEMFVAASTDQTQDLAASELASEIERALASLGSSREPVVRMHLNGYSREEIATLLGWSEAKTRNLLYRGLTDLRAALSERGIGPEANV